jgi:hypothetical protein
MSGPPLGPLLPPGIIETPTNALLCNVNTLNENISSLSSYVQTLEHSMGPTEIEFQALSNEYNDMSTVLSSLTESYSTNLLTYNELSTTYETFSSGLTNEAKVGYLSSLVTLNFQSIIASSLTINKSLNVGSNTIDDSSFFNAAIGSNNTLNSSFGLLVGQLNVGAGIGSVVLNYGNTITNTEFTSATYSHAEGFSSLVYGNYSHVEGGANNQYGNQNHIEGYSNNLYIDSSHIEGLGNIGTYNNVTFSGDVQHGEGYSTIVQGNYGHAEGAFTYTNENRSHVEGNATVVNASNSHAEGWLTNANYFQNHVEGYSTYVNASNGHAEGQLTRVVSTGSHAEGFRTIVTGAYAHAEGWSSFASSIACHAEGFAAEADGAYSHAEGMNTMTGGIVGHVEGSTNRVVFDGSHVEGKHNSSIGSYCHVEGQLNLTSTVAAHAEGISTQAMNIGTHAQGSNTRVTGQASHAHGIGTSVSAVSGNYSHSHAFQGNVAGLAATVTGCNTTANSIYSFSGGLGSGANGSNTFAMGTVSIIQPNYNYVSMLGGHSNFTRIGGSTGISSGVQTSVFSGVGATILGGNSAYVRANWSIANSGPRIDLNFGTVQTEWFNLYGTTSTTNTYCNLVYLSNKADEINPTTNFIPAFVENQRYHMNTFEVQLTGYEKENPDAIVGGAGIFSANYRFNCYWDNTSTMSGGSRFRTWRLCDSDGNTIGVDTFKELCTINTLNVLSGNPAVTLQAYISSTTFSNFTNTQAITALSVRANTGVPINWYAQVKQGMIYWNTALGGW